MLDFGPRQLVLGLLVSASIGNTLIFFADTEGRAVLSELVTVIAATSAVLLAMAIAFRQEKHAPHGKSYLALALGLVLWVAADAVWAAYELYFHVAAQIPSYSDYLWLAGYPFFAYNLFHTYRDFRKRISRRVVVASIIGNGIFLAYLIPLTANLIDPSSPAGLAMFAIIIAYPISNAVLTIPAFPILLGLWKDKPWSIPWTFKALSLFCIVVTDSWFAFIVITGLQEQVWLSSMLFSAEYLIMAGGLIWYNKFLSTYKANHGPEFVKNVPATRKITPARTRTPYDIIIAIVLVATVVTYSIIAAKDTSATEIIPPVDGSASIKIGALLPLSGTLSSFGESAEASLILGQKDINKQFQESGSDARLELIIEDTKTDPTIALEKIKKLDSAGVKIVIGPATSAAVMAVKEYADQHGMLIISVSSTAPQLAIPNDNVYRFVPDDTNQAAATAKKMWQDGIRVVVPMWRTDIFGEGLHSALMEDFSQLGGTVVDGVGYKPPTGDFAASLHRINFIFWEQDLKTLTSKVSGAIKQHGSDKVAVYAVSYDEIVPIMIQADRHPELSSVRWYGSDGSALNADLVKDEQAAKFAVKTGFANPIFAVEETDRFAKISEQITDEIGHPHRSYAEIAYDALHVAVQSTVDIHDKPDLELLRKSLVSNANSYDGITGQISLNESGDRRGGSYDFWSVVSNEHGTKYEWSSITH